MNRKKEKGFALVLSLVLLLVMSLMGGSLIVITSSDHQSNNNSDQYQQAFYVAETGLLQGEKWVVDQYLGPWTEWGDLPSAEEALGSSATGTTPAEIAAWEAQKEAYNNATSAYHKHKNNMTRFEYNRGPPLNDTTISKDVKTDCMKSFKNLEYKDNIVITGGGTLPKRTNFINIVGPILLNESCTDYETCINYKADLLVEKTDTDLGFAGKAADIAEKEVKYLRRFEYEFFVTNVGPAAYTGSGSSVAKTTSSSDSQGSAYKIYACGVFYGKSSTDTNAHSGEVEILIPLETVIVMPS
jgi:hypothetical protein